MRRQLRTVAIGWLATASVFLATAARGAEPPPDPTSLLIRYVRTATTGFFGTFITGTEDALIFRDGLVIEHVYGNTGVCWFQRGTPSPEYFKELRDALARNRIALQTGNCGVPDGTQHFAVETEVTWFGRGGRQHSYRTSNQAAGSCPDSTVEIDYAIQAVLGSATVRGVYTLVKCPV